MSDEPQNTQQELIVGKHLNSDRGKLMGLAVHPFWPEYTIAEGEEGVVH